MYNRIVYVVKSELSYYPPCMSQIMMLHDLGVDIEVWFGSSKQTAIDELNEAGIPYKELVDPRLRKKSKVDVLNNWGRFRHAFLVEAKKYGKDTLFWFGNAETSMPLVGAMRGMDYVASALELYDDIPMKRRLFGIVARGAKLVTACETTRAYIMKSWWGLKDLPVVFPNKPYGMRLTKELTLTCPETEHIVSALDGAPFVIYQGIFQNEEYVSALAEALRSLDGDLALVMMGIDRRGIGSRIVKIYDKTMVYESIPAPKHLEVTSRASIGVVFYDGANLNKAFCAPNKIYEYSAFGLPMLANRIPGLLNTVGAAGAAECVDFVPENLERAILRIQSDRAMYEENARAFFEDTDNVATMQSVVKQLDIQQW